MCEDVPANEKNNYTAQHLQFQPSLEPSSCILSQPLKKLAMQLGLGIGLANMFSLAIPSKFTTFTHILSVSNFFLKQIIIRLSTVECM